jgi:hypothetical protein
VSCQKNVFDNLGWQYNNPYKKNSIKKTSNKSGKVMKMEMQQLLTIEKEKKSSLPVMV